MFWPRLSRRGNELSDPKERPLTVREAGRRGGQRTAELHGVEHYQRIGKKGGSRVKELLARAKDAEKEERLG